MNHLNLTKLYEHANQPDLSGAEHLTASRGEGAAFEERDESATIFKKLYEDSFRLHQPV